MDFSKAVNKVSRSCFMYKLQRIGIDKQTVGGDTIFPDLPNAVYSGWWWKLRHNISHQ